MIQSMSVYHKRWYSQWIDNIKQYTPTNDTVHECIVQKMIHLTMIQWVVEKNKKYTATNDTVHECIAQRMIHLPMIQSMDVLVDKIIENLNECYM